MNLLYAVFVAYCLCLVVMLLFSIIESCVESIFADPNWLSFTDIEEAPHEAKRD